MWVTFTRNQVVGDCPPLSVFHPVLCFRYTCVEAWGSLIRFDSHVIWSVPIPGSPRGLQGSGWRASLWAPMAGVPRGKTAESQGVLVRSVAGQHQLVLQSLHGFIPATSEHSGFPTFSSVLSSLCQPDWVWSGTSPAYL